MKIIVNLCFLRHPLPARDRCSGSGSVAELVEAIDKAIFSYMDNAGFFSAWHSD
jgi:hypothetical protein